MPTGSEIYEAKANLCEAKLTRLTQKQKPS